MSKQFIYSQQKMIAPVSHRLAIGEIFIFSTVSPSKDSPNEDAAALVALDDKTAILAVADGLGGLPAGEQASKLSLEVLANTAQIADSPEVRGAILNGIEQANHQILASGSGAATTLAVAELQGTVIRPYHAGDSMILVTGQRGKIKLQTVSHSPVGYAIEAGLLDESEAMHHAERHIVSNMVGIPDMRIEVGFPLKLAKRDTLLLATDGLFDNMHIHEIVNTIRKGPLEQAAEQLITSARQRMMNPGKGTPSKPDDLTFILFRRA